MVTVLSLNDPSLQRLLDGLSSWTVQRYLLPSFRTVLQGWSNESMRHTDQASHFGLTMMFHACRRIANVDLTGTVEQYWETFR